MLRTVFSTVAPLARSRPRSADRPRQYRRAYSFIFAAGSAWARGTWSSFAASGWGPSRTPGNLPWLRPGLTMLALTISAIPARLGCYRGAPKCGRQPASSAWESTCLNGPMDTTLRTSCRARWRHCRAGRCAEFPHNRAETRPSKRRERERNGMKTATVAGTKRVADSSEGRGRTFESCRVRHLPASAMCRRHKPRSMMQRRYWRSRWA